jgi:hypothetical protein
MADEPAAHHPREPDMNDFDQRWQRLVATARQSPARRAPLSDLHAARLAAHGLQAARRQREAEAAWRGMAAAAGLFLVCLIGLGAAASTLAPAGTTAAVAMALDGPSIPGTSFIPSPPRPPALASRAAHWSPTRVFGAVGAWLDPRPPAPETSP